MSSDQLALLGKICGGILIALCFFSAYILKQKGDTRNAIKLVFWTIGVSVILVLSYFNHVSLSSGAPY